MFTFLSLVFLVILILAVFYGYGIIMKRPPSKEELETEVCSLCRRRVVRSALVERQVGDSRLYFFCADCIKSLNDEAQRRPESRDSLPV